jgi:hypothetical protein
MEALGRGRSLIIQVKYETFRAKSRDFVSALLE